MAYKQNLVSTKYDPEGKIITSKTPLGPDITMAKFLGARGSRTQLGKLYNKGFDGPPDFQQIARNLLMHANLLQSIIGKAEFSQHRLTVSEGIYEPNPRFEVIEVPFPSENLAAAAAGLIKGASYGKGKDGWVVTKPSYVGEKPSGILEQRRTGEAVVYQLIDKNGKTDPRKTFDLAVYWKDYIDYDMLTLDYDTYDVSGALTCQIVIEIPAIPEDYDVTYKYDIQTLFNGQLQTANELLEIIDEESEESTLVKDVTRSLGNTANEVQESINNLFDIDLDII